MYHKYILYIPYNGVDDEEYSYYYCEDCGAQETEDFPTCEDWKNFLKIQEVLES
jgi:hypothetical protein